MIINKWTQRKKQKHEHQEKDRSKAIPLPFPYKNQGDSRVSKKDKEWLKIVFSVKKQKKTS